MDGATLLPLLFGFTILALIGYAFYSMNKADKEPASDEMNPERR